MICTDILAQSQRLQQTWQRNNSAQDRLVRRLPAALRAGTLN